MKEAYWNNENKVNEILSTLAELNKISLLLWVFVFLQLKFKNLGKLKDWSVFCELFFSYFYYVLSLGILFNNFN